MVVVMMVVVVSGHMEKSFLSVLIIKTEECPERLVFRVKSTDQSVVRTDQFRVAAI